VHRSKSIAPVFDHWHEFTEKRPGDLGLTEDRIGAIRKLANEFIGGDITARGGGAVVRPARPTPGPALSMVAKAKASAEQCWRVGSSFPRACQSRNQFSMAG
jgi:hypothetical protein